MIDGMLLAAALSVCSRHAALLDGNSFPIGFEHGWEDCATLVEEERREVEDADARAKAKQDTYDHTIIDRALKELAK